MSGDPSLKNLLQCEIIESIAQTVRDYALLLQSKSFFNHPELTGTYINYRLVSLLKGTPQLMSLFYLYLTRTGNLYILF